MNIHWPKRRSMRSAAERTSDGGGAISTPSQSLVIAPQDDLNSTVGPLGTKVIADPPNAEIDLCFVHGLTGHRDSTWTHANGTFWPALLAPLYPNARIITYGYDANVIGLWQNTNANGLRGYGEQLALEMSNIRSTSPDRPIIFLAHSLGGLVVEQALLICCEPHEPRLRALTTSTTGVLFFGTPHQGSYLASWGYTVARLLAHLWRTNHRVLSALRTDSDVLKSVEEAFQRTLRHSLTYIRICCFYEAIAVPVVGFVVPEDYAKLLAYTSCSINANHVNMTKFVGPNDQGFLLVKGQLDSWIPTASIPSQAATVDPSHGPGQEAPPTGPGIFIGHFQGNARHVGPNIAGRDQTISYGP